MDSYTKPSGRTTNHKIKTNLAEMGPNCSLVFYGRIYYFVLGVFEKIFF